MVFGLMDIKNTTAKPIRVPLAGGKRLFLGPGGKGQIAPKAAEHPPVKALIDAGDLEIQGVNPIQHSARSGNPGSGGNSSSSGASGGGVRHTGDR